MPRVDPFVGIKLYHGSSSLSRVLAEGVVMPSRRPEPFPNVASAIEAHRAWTSKHRLGPGETWEDVAPKEHKAWVDAALIPMRGFSYATSIFRLAKGYARGADGGVVEVQPLGDLSLDEDWLGCVVAFVYSECSDCDFETRGSAASFDRWARELPKLLSAKVEREIKDGLEYAHHEIDFDDYCALPMRAVVGKTAFVDLERSGRGAAERRAWLAEGLGFSTQFAHRGPLRVVGAADHSYGKRRRF
jgi:hypothetical protein